MVLGLAAGLCTLLIVGIAIFAGISLDNHFGTKPFITIGLIVLSIPLSIVLMTVIVRNGTRRIIARLGLQEEKADEIPEQEERFGGKET